MSTRDAHVLSIEEQRSLAVTSSERFDRIAFTMRLLRLLRPPMTVAVYPRRRELEVQTLRDWSRGDGGRCAMLGIPDDASREHITLAVASLAGLGGPSLTLDLLMSGDGTPEPD